MCLVLKMLQLQPEKEIVIEFIKNEDFKYVRILGAFYLRLVGKPVDIYKVGYSGLRASVCFSKRKQTEFATRIPPNIGTLRYIGHCLHTMPTFRPFALLSSASPPPIH